MKKIFLLILVTFGYVNLYATNDKVDCIILEDENSIVCKYIQPRVSYEKNVIFNWIEPDGKISRTKDLVIPENHGSVYDFRYIKNRTLGLWTVKVTDGDNEYQTTFLLKK